MSKKRRISNCYWLRLTYENGITETFQIGADINKMEQIVKTAPIGTTINLYCTKGENGKRVYDLTTKQDH